MCNAALSKPAGSPGPHTFSKIKENILLLFSLYFILSYSSSNRIMAKKVAKGGAKGGSKRAGGKAAGIEVVPVLGTKATAVAEAALPGTKEEVVAPDTRISGSAKGAAASMVAAALSANNQHVVGQVDGTQVQVAVDPCWGEAAKERYRKNRMR
jgi:hypothetical protein